MTIKEQVINAITVALADHVDISVAEVKEIIANQLQQYQLIEVKETLPSCGDGSATVFLFSKFAQAKVSAGMTRRSLYQYKHAVESVCQNAKKDLNMIDSDDIIAWIARMRRNGIASSTVKSRYLYLSSVISFLFNRKYIASNPMIEVESPKVELRLKKPLTEKEMELIRVACESFQAKKSKRMIAMIDFFYDSMVRVSELSSIKLSDVDWDNRCAVVMGKGSKERTVYFTERTMVRLREYLATRADIRVCEGKYMYAIDAPLFATYNAPYRSASKNSIEREMKEIGERSGVLRLHPHLIRATKATRLAEKGIDISVIAKLLGHANLATINRYVLMSDEKIMSIIRHAA